MGERTGISWTDHTFNPWWGCTKVSPGCDNCYADTFAARPIHKLADGSKGALDIWGKGKPRRTFDDRHWAEPLKWNKKAEQEGRKHLVFCASMADVMDDEAPAGERERLWALIDSTPHLIWQLLTKRPHRYARYLPREFQHSNVWLGITAENQEFYDIRWPILRDVVNKYFVPAWISYEPALGPLTLVPNFECYTDCYPDWVIFGGESGTPRRPCEQKWAEDLLHESKEFDVKFFVKQMGARTPAQGKQLIPAHLLIQEFPR